MKSAISSVVSRTSRRKASPERSRRGRTVGKTPLPTCSNGVAATAGGAIVLFKVILLVRGRGPEYGRAKSRRERGERARCRLVSGEPGACAPPGPILPGYCAHWQGRCDTARLAILP